MVLDHPDDNGPERIEVCLKACNGISTNVLKETLTTSDQPLLDAAMFGEIADRDLSYAITLLSECIDALELYKAYGWRCPDNTVSAVKRFIEEMEARNQLPDGQP